MAREPRQYCFVDGITSYPIMVAYCPHAYASETMPSHYAPPALQSIAVNSLSELYSLTMTKCRPYNLRLAADEERSTSAPFCCQGVGPRHARLRLRGTPVPLRALDSGRCVAAWAVSAPEECRSLSHQRNAGVWRTATPLPSRHPLTMPRLSKDCYAWGNGPCQNIVSIHDRRSVQRNLELRL